MTMEFIPQFEPFFDGGEGVALNEYMCSGGWVTEFRETQQFEQLISNFTGSTHCIVTNNGTVSLTIALLGAGVKPGDEVLIPDITMIGTPNACKIFGAKPVFVDIDPNNLCMDLKAVEDAITPRTKALIYVSLHGRCGDMEELDSLCKKYNLILIEDAAQSLGSYQNGRHLGRFGVVGTLSFSTPKIVTTGQGGAVITDDDDIAENIRRIKDFGRASGGTDLHETIGYNFKFTDIQAVLGLTQFKSLGSRIHKKRRIYQRYKLGLSRLEMIEMLPTDLNETTPWFIDIYVDEPDALAEWLKEMNIGTRRIYPAIHTQKAYDLTANCPNAELMAKRGLWLPSSVQLEDAQIDYVVDKIVEYYERF